MIRADFESGLNVLKVLKDSRIALLQCNEGMTKTYYGLDQFSLFFFKKKREN